MPKVVKSAEGSYEVVTDAATSLGSVSHWLGNFAVELRALAYILSLGADG